MVSHVVDKSLIICVSHAKDFSKLKVQPHAWQHYHNAQHFLDQLTATWTPKGERYSELKACLYLPPSHRKWVSNSHLYYACRVEPVLKNHPISHKIVVCQDRRSLVTNSVILNCRCFWQKVLVFQDRWSHVSGLSRHVSLYFYISDCKKHTRKFYIIAWTSKFMSPSKFSPIYFPALVAMSVEVHIHIYLLLLYVYIQMRSKRTSAEWQVAMCLWVAPLRGWSLLRHPRQTWNYSRTVCLIWIWDHQFTSSMTRKGLNFISAI